MVYVVYSIVRVPDESEVYGFIHGYSDYEDVAMNVMEFVRKETLMPVTCHPTKSIESFKCHPSFKEVIWL